MLKIMLSIKYLMQIRLDTFKLFLYHRGVNKIAKIYISIKVSFGCFFCTHPKYIKHNK